MKNTLYPLTAAIATTSMLACSAPSTYTKPEHKTEQTTTVSKKDHMSTRQERASKLTPEQFCLEEIFDSFHPNLGDAYLDQQACRDIKPMYQQGINHVTKTLERNLLLQHRVTEVSPRLTEYADLAQSTTLLLRVTQEKAFQYATLYPNSDFDYQGQLADVRKIAVSIISDSKDAAQTLVANHAIYTDLRTAYRTGNLKESFVIAMDQKIDDSIDVLDALPTREQTIKHLAKAVITYKQALDKDMTLRQQNNGILPGEKF